METTMVGMLSCIMQLVQLGLSCSTETPKDRPTMPDVYTESLQSNENQGIGDTVFVRLYVTSELQSMLVLGFYKILLYC